MYDGKSYEKFDDNDFEWYTKGLKARWVVIFPTTSSVNK